MKLIFFISLFVAAANADLPAHFVEIGHYGIHFGTRKTYYYSGISQATGINHISLCINAGLEPLHLSSIEEHDYFLNVYRSITTVQLPHSHIGAQKNGDDFVWKGTGERINYPVHWYQSYPKPERTNNCLLVANRPEDGGTAYFNHPCSAVYPYICQKIGG